MENIFSVLDDLKNQFGSYLVPGLLHAYVKETEDNIYIEYTIQSTEECVITYKHNLSLWGSGRNSFSWDEMIDMGYSPQDLEQISGETYPFIAADFFIANYIHGDATSLAMRTSIFTEEVFGILYNNHKKE